MIICVYFLSCHQLVFIFTSILQKVHNVFVNVKIIFLQIIKPTSYFLLTLFTYMRIDFSRS